MEVKPIKTRVFNENEDLIKFINQHVKTIPEKSILVVTSKIVSLSEGRTWPDTDPDAKIKLIKKESQWVKKTKYTWLTIRENMVMTSAGIDESNARGKLILLPKDCYRSATEIRKRLMKTYHVKNLGVLIPDSRLLPFRAGAIGSAVGYAGFKGIRDYRGKPDIFGKKLKVSRTNIADGLATAAVIMMGEADEQQPLAIIKNAPVEFTDKIQDKEMLIDITDDIYRPLFEKAGKINLPRNPEDSKKYREANKENEKQKR